MAEKLPVSLLDHAFAEAARIRNDAEQHPSSTPTANVIHGLADSVVILANELKILRREARGETPASGTGAASTIPRTTCADNPYETIRVIENWELGFNLGNAVKYISRAGKKEGASARQDLEKAAWYLARELGR